MQGRELHFHFLGNVPYHAALALQNDYAARVEQSPHEAHVLGLTHPPTITLGRRGGRQNILVSEPWLAARGVEIVETERGGDVTYHGPEQVILYPVLALDRLATKPYVADLMSSMIIYLAGLGLAAEADSARPGAYVGRQKIGFIGLRVQNGVTRHGLALNLASDLSPFSWLNPCGEPGLALTSVGQLCPDRIPSHEDAARGLFDAFRTVCSTTGVSKNEGKPNQA